MNPTFLNAEVPQTSSARGFSSGAKGVTGGNSHRDTFAVGTLRWRSSYLAFFAAVFACVAASATVASNDAPLILGVF